MRGVCRAVCRLGWGLVFVLVGCWGNQGTFPSRAMTLVCPWAAGGGTDAVSRFWADALQGELGQPCLVVNRTGGSGVVGHSFGARARADGHTLTMITFELCTMHQMGLTDLTYRAFRPIIQMNADPAAIVVHRGAPWNTLREFLEDVRRQPGQLTMSGTARGGAWDLARCGLLLADGQSVEAIRWIPAAGAAPSLVELLGRHIDSVCCSVPEAAASLEQLKILAVMADERLEEYPDVPTAKENGVDWTMVGFRGLAVPEMTSDEIYQRLVEICLDIADSPQFVDFMQRTGYRTEVRGPDEFAKFLSQEDAKWTEVIERAGLGRRG